MNDEKLPRDYYQTLMLNESAIHALGFQSVEEALNQIVFLHLWANEFEKYKIVGIVEDYHHEALKKEVTPIIFTQNYNRFQQVYFSVKLNAGTDPQEALTYIGKSWKEFFPTKPFDYFFLDEYYDQQFKSEKHFERIFGSFAVVAVFLACLGILGISLFEANARLKEISIRKILGASVVNLVALLSKDNMKMVLLSCLLATPVIYFVSRNWLSTYPVRIQLSPIVFVIPLAVLLAVVFLMSIVQTAKTALTNPVDHLKND
jgi:putative ABC transport system permease protein